MGDDEDELGEQWAHALTWNEAWLWAEQLNYDPNWKELLREAGLGSKVSNRDNIKSKWRDFPPLRTQRAIRRALQRAEAKRKTPTQMGAVITGLEEWHGLGEQLAKRPALFLRVKARVEDLIGQLQVITPTEAVEAARAKIEAIESGLNPFEPPNEPEPPRSRPTSRRDFTPERPRKR